MKSLEKNTLIQPIREKLIQLVQESNKTYEAIGLGMGYNPSAAKTLIYRLLHTDRDPQISTFRTYAFG